MMAEMRGGPEDGAKLDVLDDPPPLTIRFPRRDRPIFSSWRAEYDQPQSALPASVVYRLVGQENGELIYTFEA